MKKINLLFTVWGLSYGGAERFVLNLVKQLDKRKYNIVVFSDNQKKGPMQNDFEKSGVKVIYSNVHRFKHPLKYLRLLKEIITEEKIDIIHANDDLNMIFPLLAKSKEIKFVSHSHTTKFKFTKNKFLSFVAQKIISKYISKYSDSRLSCGFEAGKALYGKKKYQVINNGVEIEKFKFSKKKRALLRKDYKIKDDETVILNVGRISEEKNQDFLIDVFAKYRKLNRKSKLVIIGDGNNKQLLVEKIKTMRLKNNVILLPSQDDIAKFYNMADIFVLPSLFEGMPMTSVEAQINGLVCVFSDAVPKEADHLGNAEFLPLQSTPKEWANKIHNLSLERQKYDSDVFSNYDVKNMAITVDGIYANFNCYKKMNKCSAKVSIIVPAYNAEDYIDRCLGSLVSQTYSNIEIIVVDDGSKDNTRNIVHANNDPRIILLENSHRGPNMARKRGVDIATGRYMMFVDADDYIDKNAVRLVVNNFELNDVDAIRFNARRVDNKKIVLPILSADEDKKIIDKPEILRILFTSYGLNSLCTQAYKTSQVKKIDAFETDISYGEDFLANLAIHKSTKKVLIINDSLYQYCYNPTSTTRNTNLKQVKKNIDDRIFVSKKAIELAAKSGFFDDATMQEIVFKQMAMIRDATMELSTLDNYKKDDFMSDFRNVFSENAVPKVDVEELIGYMDKQKIVSRLKYRRMLRAISESDYNTIWNVLVLHRWLRKWRRSYA